MLKFIVTGLIIYMVYRTFIKRPAIGKGNENNHRADYSNQVPPSSSKNNNDMEGEYIDYEEVE